VVWIAVLCALLGAFFLAIGAQRQSSAVKDSTGGLALNTNGFLRLLRSPRWVLGLVLLALGMGLNVVALASAPLTVVQPIGAIALVITTIVNSKDQGIRLNRMTIVAITACVSGSALFVLLAVNVTQETHGVSVEDELTTVLLLAVVVLIFGTLALSFRHRLNAFAYILGAGMLFGFVAVLTRLITIHLFDPNGRFLANVPWYSVIAIAVAGLLGSWFVQSAYASGPPDLVVAGLTVIDPIVGIAIGIVILDELRPDVQAVMAISMGIASLVAIVGVIALSRHHPDVIQRQDEARRRRTASVGTKPKTD
jgi:drug/metabolite transporter (DMT)-like permease